MQTNFTRWIGLLILLGVFAAAVLLLMPVTAPAPVAEAVTQIPVAAPVQAYPPPMANTPLPTLVYAYPPPGSTQSAAMRVPLCQFQGGATAPEVNDVALEDYVFSEPRVVLTSTRGINLVEWLPDSQRVLLTFDMPEQQQTIELFNPQTRSRQIYATRKWVDAPPIWFSGLNSVAYPVQNIVSFDQNNHQYEFTRQIWVSHGDPGNPQLVEDGLSNFFIAVKPDENQIAYLSNQQLIQRNSMLEVSQSIQLDLTQWEYRRDIYPPADYRMAWQPDNSRIFLYSNGDTGGYTFLFDTDTQQICEVDLGGWAVVARWNPNGRYLAVVRAKGTQPVKYTDLAVLDIVTGTLYTMSITPSDITGKHFVSDIAWNTNNHYLAVIGQVFGSQQTCTLGEGDCHELDALYWVDFLTRKSIQVIQGYSLGSNIGETNLVFSPDNTQLLVQCTTIHEGRLCLISIHKNTP